MAKDAKLEKLILSDNNTKVDFLSSQVEVIKSEVKVLKGENRRLQRRIERLVNNKVTSLT